MTRQVVGSAVKNGTELGDNYLFPSRARPPFSFFFPRVFVVPAAAGLFYNWSFSWLVCVVCSRGGSRLKPVIFVNVLTWQHSAVLPLAIFQIFSSIS